MSCRQVDVLRRVFAVISKSNLLDINVGNYHHFCRNCQFCVFTAAVVLLCLLSAVDIAVT